MFDPREGAPVAKSRRPAPPPELPAGAKVLATQLPAGITDWHLKLKPGAHVQYTMDSGQVVNRKVGGRPVQASDGTWTVALVGNSMACPLEWLRPFKKKPSPRAAWDGPMLAPGEVVCEFSVEGRAVPYGPPPVNRHGRCFPNPKYMAWKRHVGKAASLAMAGRDPYGGPVELRLTFHLRPGHEVGRGVQTPDLCNLTKLTEDALQGSAIVNDSAVRSHRNRRVIDDRDYVTIKVIAD